MAGRKRVRMLLFTVSLWVFVVGMAATGAAESLDGLWQLQGWVGSYPTTAVLEIEGLRTQGFYSYDRFQQQIPLLGIIERSGALVMFELDAADNRTGTFSGVLSEVGFAGHWADPETEHHLKVYWETVARDVWSGVWNRAFVGADGQWKRAIHESASVEFWDWNGETAAMEVWASSGSHMGFAEGQVSIDGKTAVFHDPDLGGMFRFERQGSNLVVTAEGADVYAGFGVGFDGVYRQQLGPESDPTLWDLGVFPTQELDAAFRELVGEHYYEKYLSTFHLFQFREDSDGLDAVVVDGFVRGLAGDMFGRIMYTRDGYFIAAISEGDGWLTYISNHPRFKFDIPKTFEDLRDRLAFG